MNVINSYSHVELGGNNNVEPEVDEDLDQEIDEDESQDESSSISNSIRETAETPESIDENNTNNEMLFRKSLFPHVPPYIIFHSYDSAKHQLPSAITKHLKWKLSNITPLLVRKTVVNSGFRLVKKSKDWVGTWGKHMKSVSFKVLKDNQKVNHFPGTFQLGRKDRLWRNLSKLIIKFGRKEFGFVPCTYVLPQDLRIFRQVWEKSGGREKWIIKPPASARGQGIRVVHKWSQIPKKKALIVQQYISKPLLICGAKFDLRLYVLVTSVNPLRLYIYPDGLVRFASVKYNDDINFLSDRFMHLTNYSINKTSTTYASNDLADSCNGHKWTLKTFWKFLEKEEINCDKIWKSIKDVIIKTVIAAESPMSVLTKLNTTTRYNCYELFGVDILLDEKYKPWLIEFNISPSLQSSTELDISVKGPLIKNLFNLICFQLPTKLSESKGIDCLNKLYDVDSIVQNIKLNKTSLTVEEKQKHMLYSDLDREDYLDDILEELTPDDVKQLISLEDELTQIDQFERLFPTKDTFNYLEYFDVPRYYNLLLDAWETKYSDNRESGIELLQNLCQDKYHLNQQSK